MIPPRDSLTAQDSAAPPTIDAAIVVLRLAAGARCHPSEPRRPLAPFISRRAETTTKILPASPRRVAANRQRLVASTTGGVQSP